MAPVQPTVHQAPQAPVHRAAPHIQAQACSAVREILFPSTQLNICPCCISQGSFWPPPPSCLNGTPVLEHSEWPSQLFVT